MGNEIVLASGEISLVDEIDFEFLNQWPWYCHLARGHVYAARHERRSETGRIDRATIFIHQIVLTRMDLIGLADHRNNDGLDNRRENIRVSTYSTNGANRGKQRNNSSGYKGVFDLGNGSYRAYIRINNVTHNLGHYSSPERAALRYNAVAKRVFGEFAYQNEVSHS